MLNVDRAFSISIEQLRFLFRAIPKYVYFFTRYISQLLILIIVRVADFFSLYLGIFCFRYIQRKSILLQIVFIFPLALGGPLACLLVLRCHQHHLIYNFAIYLNSLSIYILYFIGNGYK